MWRLYGDSVDSDTFKKILWSGDCPRLLWRKHDKSNYYPISISILPKKNRSPYCLNAIYIFSTYNGDNIIFPPDELRSNSFTSSQLLASSEENSYIVKPNSLKMQMTWKFYCFTRKFLKNQEHCRLPSLNIFQSYKGLKMGKMIEKMAQRSG